MKRLAFLTVLVPALFTFALAQGTPPTTPPAQAGAARGGRAGGGRAQGPQWPTTAGDFAIENFHFNDGETMAKLNIHYLTLGKPRKDANGIVQNAVLIMHGTGGTGSQFLGGSWANVLYGPGQLLDITKYYIILPDAIGHGKSSKPSEGMHAKFPKFGYIDVVNSEYDLLTQGLGVNHLRLTIGTSMGGMLSWLWPEMYPDFMDASMPLASLPVQIAGRNRYFRDMVIQGITSDPAWNNGEYTTPPVMGLRSAIEALMVMTSSPKDMQRQNATQQQADQSFENTMSRDLRTEDANDMLYQFRASSDYNPEPDLNKIKCYLMAVNSADDQVNPPEVGEETVVPLIKNVAHGKYVLIPIGPQTRGHGTHTLAAVWQDYLWELLHESETPANKPQ